MSGRMDARLRKLETQTTAQDAFPRYVVLWDNEPYPDDLRARDLVVRLNHKAESAEQWALDVRRRHEGRMP